MTVDLRCPCQYIIISSDKKDKCRKNETRKDNWCAIRYSSKNRNLDTGKEVVQQVMEFVRFKVNPAPIGVRVVEGWAISTRPNHESY